MIRRLELGRRDVADRSEQTAMVEPVHPLERRVLDRVDVSPGPPAPDHLRLVETDHRLGEGVVVRVADTPYRPLDAGLGQTLGVANGQILAAPVAVMHEVVARSPRVKACSS